MIKKACIKWTGRLTADLKLNLSVGLPYYPHIVLEDNSGIERRSVKFIVSEMDDKMQSVIDLEMLVDNSDSRQFVKQLSPHVKFVLLEGSTQVAQGYILE